MARAKAAWTSTWVKQSIIINGGGAKIEAAWVIYEMDDPAAAQQAAQLLSSAKKIIKGACTQALAMFPVTTKNGITVTTKTVGV